LRDGYIKLIRTDTRSVIFITMHNVVYIAIKGLTYDEK